MYLAVLSLPMFVAGTWLGVLVIVGQSKKQGHLNFITALILLFDVGFKIGATIFCEVYDLWFIPWRQRRRQRAAEARRASERQALPADGQQQERERELAPTLQPEGEQALSAVAPASLPEGEQDLGGAHPTAPSTALRSEVEGDAQLMESATAGPTAEQQPVHLGQQHSDGDSESDSGLGHGADDIEIESV